VGGKGGKFALASGEEGESSRGLLSTGLLVIFICSIIFYIIFLRRWAVKNNKQVLDKVI